MPVRAQRWAVALLDFSNEQRNPTTFFPSDGSVATFVDFAELLKLC